MNISFLKEKGSKYIVFVLLGLLILVMCIPTTSKSSDLSLQEEKVSNVDLENRLEEVLSAMEGVGRVEVMITTESTGDNMFYSENAKEKVCGVVVVAEGAGVASVNARILEAVKALFSVDAHKISIVKMKSQEVR